MVGAPLCAHYTPFHQHFVIFPPPRHCHACSGSGHIAAFGHSHPPCHPQSGVTPLQHWPQRPFFWEAGTLIGGPPPLSSYPWQCFTHVHVPTTSPKGHPSGWLVHPLSAHHHLPSPSGTLCMCVHAHVPNPAAFLHLDMSICPCQPSCRTFSPLTTPTGSNFPMGGVPPRYPPHPISTFPTFVHTCAPTLANPAPTWAPCPPAHPSAHLHTPCTSFFPGFFLHPLHFLCPGTLPSPSHGPWVGKFFFLGKTLTCHP